MQRTPWTGRTWNASYTLPGSPPSRSRRAQAGRSPRHAGASSPRPASGWAWAKTDQRRRRRDHRPGVPDRARRGHLRKGPRPLRRAPRRPLGLVADFSDRTVRMPVSDTRRPAIDARRQDQHGRARCPLRTREHHCWTGHIIRDEPTPGQEPELDDLDVTTRADGTALSRSYSAGPTTGQWWAAK
jgi:hypothetical protein